MKTNNHLEKLLPHRVPRVERHPLRVLWGVEIDVVAGCCVTDELVENARGYNECMDQEIDRRFRPNSLAKLQEEARSE